MFRSLRAQVALVLLMMVPAFSQEMNKFKLSLPSAGLSGTEEFAFIFDDKGKVLKGSVHVTSPKAMEMTYSQEMTPDWTLTHYALDADKGAQKIEVARQGDLLKMSVAFGERSQAKEAAWKPNTFMLDNLVTAHYQVLLNAIARTQSSVDAQLVVAQRMMAIPGKVTQLAASETGTLNGKPVQLRKLNIEIGPMLVEVLADADGRLMRMFVPLQQFEAIREGFAFQAAKTEEASSNCVSREVSFVSDDLKVPATLCLPRNATAVAKVPLVILVHGSGVHDRDETIGPNKPFRDIAEGLAGSGIATLRYDKRSFFAKSTFNAESTVEQEVLHDAVNAVKFASSLAEVDAKSIFVAGHSLGGSMAPFIANRSAGIRGIVMLAAAALPLDETVIRQITTQFRRAGTSEADIQKKLAELKEQFGRIRAGIALPTDRPLGGPAAYWHDLLARDVPSELTKVQAPVLVLQGGKDIQVAQADFELLRKTIAGRKSVLDADHLYPGLNHLFMAVEGDSTGAEYSKAGHLSPEVTKTISEWIRLVTQSPTGTPAR